MEDPKRGQRVSWRSHGTRVVGTVVRKVTSSTRLAGRTVRASREAPQFLVRSAKTGREAVHKASALRPARGSR